MENPSGLRNKENDSAAKRKVTVVSDSIVKYLKGREIYHQKKEL